MLSLRFCARAFSSCGKWGPLFIAVRGPLTIAASLAAEHRLQTRRLSNCGSQAQLLRGMWDLPRPGLEPVSPALAGRLSTTAPPGKPQGMRVFFSFPWHQVCGVFSNTTCPALWHQLGVLQFSSILTLIPGATVRLHRLKAQSHKTAFTSQVVGPQVTCQTWLHSQGFPQPPSSGSIICENNSQNSRECYTYYCSLLWRI